jgi:hypothetical protein
MGIVFLLLAFWLYLAYRAYDRGNLQMAGVYVLIGVGLTAWRLAAARKSG